MISWQMERRSRPLDIFKQPSRCAKKSIEESTGRDNGRLVAIAALKSRDSINFESRLMTDKTPSDDQLFIHLDLDGLAALLKAAEAAMATGRGRLELGSGGITVRSGTAPFARVTLTFSDPAGGGGLALAA